MVYRPMYYRNPCEFTANCKSWLPLKKGRKRGREEAMGTVGGSMLHVDVAVSDDEMEGSDSQYDLSFFPGGG
jgi:hypothetical protein